jgi:hypothetical protein
MLCSLGRAWQCKKPCREFIKALKNDLLYDGHLAALRQVQSPFHRENVVCP